MLKDIFNPSDMAAMELDSVFQLKNICKGFYRKKQLMSTALIQTLDALSNERPNVLQMKRRHFNPDVAPNKRESLEWMRINAERERIYLFKSIAKDTATQYYTILDRFSQELLNPKASQRPSAARSIGGESPMSVSNVNSPMSPNRRKASLLTGSVGIAEEDDQPTASKREGAEIAGVGLGGNSSMDGAESSAKPTVTTKQAQNFRTVMTAAYKEN